MTTSTKHEHTFRRIPMGPVMTMCDFSQGDPGVTGYPFREAEFRCATCSRQVCGQCHQNLTGNGTRMGENTA